MNVNELEDASSSSSSANTTSHSSPNHRPPPLDDKRSNKSTTTKNNNTAGTGCIGCGGGGGWEVFIWGGPERGNGENEPIYAEELRGVGICQIALTSSSSNNNNDGTTTGTTTNNNNTNTANLNLTQNNNNNDDNNNNNDDVVDHDHQVDPRHCATAIVLTNDQEILEWGPSSHWNKVPHRSRRLHSLSSSSSFNSFGATFKALESRKGTDSSSSTDFTTAGTAATTTTTTREIIQIQSGLDHFAAVTNQGHLYTWGNPSCGKLGHHNNNNNAGSMMTTTTRTILPKRVLQGLDPNIPIRQVACGDEHTLALTITGQVYSWGRRDIAGHNVMYRMGSSNALGGGGLGGGIGEGGGAGGAMRGLIDGVLAGGDLQLTPRLLHIPAATPTNNNDDENNNNENYDNGQEDDRIIVGVQIAACAKHSAIVTDDGTLYTWGKDNHGQLGHGDKRIYLQPKLVESIVNVVITTTTTTNNNRRNHNNRNNSQRTTNINNRNMSQQQHQQQQQWNIQTCLVSSQTIHISKVSCGTYHMAIVTEQGKLYTFGNNKGGQLGSGNKEEQCYPTLVPYFMGGSSSSTSTTNNNTGNQSTTPRHNHQQQPQPQHHNIFQVACGKYHTAALTQKGDVYTWYVFLLCVRSIYMCVFLFVFVPVE